MTLEETIEQEKLQIEENRDRLARALISDNQHLFDTCIQNIEEHEQLIELLEELKSYRQYIDLTEIQEQYKLGFQDGIIYGNNKAIDDFKSRLEERILAGKMIDEKLAYIDNCDIDEIAEQLKAGGKE